MSTCLTCYILPVSFILKPEAHESPSLCLFFCLDTIKQAGRHLERSPSLICTGCLGREGYTQGKKGKDDDLDGCPRCFLATGADEQCQGKFSLSKEAGDTHGCSLQCQAVGLGKDGAVLFESTVFQRESAGVKAMRRKQRCGEERLEVGFVTDSGHQTWNRNLQPVWALGVKTHPPPAPPK